MDNYENSAVLRVHDSLDGSNGRWGYRRIVHHSIQIGNRVLEVRINPVPGKNDTHIRCVIFEECTDKVGAKYIVKKTIRLTGGR